MYRNSLSRLAAILITILVCLVPVMEASLLAPVAPSSVAPFGPGIPDFTISTSSSALTLGAGSSGSTGVTLSSIGGFSGLILLSTQSYLLDVALDKQNVTLTAGGSGLATLTIVVPVTATPGNYTVTVNGASGCSTLHSKDITVTVAGPDFTISLSKPALLVSPGGFDSSLITLTSTTGFSGLVGLFAYPSGGLSSLPSPSSVPVPLGGSGSSNLTVFAPPSTQPGNYTIELIASSGSLVHFVEVLVTVTGPGFTVNADPFFLEVSVGGSNSSTITVKPFGGFMGLVTLYNSSSPAGLEALFAPPSLSLPGVGTSSLTVAVPPGTPLGFYDLTISGVNPMFNATIDIPVLVKGPDFSITTSPEEISLRAGGPSCTSIITVSPLSGFTGLVTLANSTFPAGLTVTMSKTSITTSGTSSLTISAPALAVPGFYYIAIDANSTSTFHIASVLVNVTGPDFTLSATPSSISITALSTGNANANSTITVTSLQGFTGTVSLTVVVAGTNMTGIISPASVTSPGTATLTVTVGNESISGVYTAIIVGTSGSLTHTDFVSVTVVAPDFSISASPTTISIDTFTTSTSTITIGSLNGFTGTVGLFIYAPLEVNATIAPASITASGTAILSVNSTIPGTYTVEVDGISGFLFHPTFVSVTVAGPDFSIASTPSTMSAPAGSSATSTITVAPLNGFSGSVNITTISPLGLTASLNAASITLSTAATLTVAVASDTPVGTYYVSVIGSSGLLTHTATVTVQVTDFTLAASPTSVSVLAGASGSSTLTIAPVNSFTGTVTLTYSASPSGLTCTLTPSSITLGSSQTSALSCSGPTGVYTVTVTGNSGSISLTSTVTITVEDFSITASPTTVSIATGASATSTVTVSFLNSFTGTVALSDTVSPSTGITCSLSSSSLTSTGTSSLSCTTSASGTFVVSVTASNGALSHTALFTISSSTPNFTITASPTSLSIQAGSSATATVTVAPLNGFSGTVILSATSSPTGPTSSFSTSAISGGSGSSTVTINVDGSVAASSYTITIQGMSGSLSNTVQITLTVTAQSTGSNTLGLPSTTFYGIIIVLVLAGVGAGLYFTRFRKKTQ